MTDTSPNQEVSSFEGKEHIIKVDVLGRRRTPREDREAILEEFEKSGMAGTRFAHAHGIKYTTFASWVQRRRREGVCTKEKGQEALALTEVIVAPTPSELAIELPGGATIKLSHPNQVDLAAALLAGMHQGSRSNTSPQVGS